MNSHRPGQTSAEPVDTESNDTKNLQRLTVVVQHNGWKIRIHRQELHDGVRTEAFNRVLAADGGDDDITMLRFQAAVHHQQRAFINAGINH